MFIKKNKPFTRRLYEWIGNPRDYYGAELYYQMFIQPTHRDRHPVTGDQLDTE